MAAAEAFLLFTPRGEQEWARGWEPVFPARELDDTEPGTIFTTDAHGRRTTWIVTDRRPPTRIGYARVGTDRAGTVTVEVTARGDHSEVDVVYDLTAFTVVAEADLERFAEGYASYLESWEHHILTSLEKRAPDAASLRASNESPHGDSRTAGSRGVAEAPAPTSTEDGGGPSPSRRRNVGADEYRGTLLAESLELGAVIELPLSVDRISRAASGDTDAGQPLVWTALEFSLAAEHASRLAEDLGRSLEREGGWYCDFRSQSEVVVVFRDRIFRYQPGDRVAREEAERYAASMGVPASQIDWPDATSD